MAEGKASVNNEKPLAQRNRLLKSCVKNVQVVPLAGPGRWRGAEGVRVNGTRARGEQEARGGQPGQQVAVSPRSTTTSSPLLKVSSGESPLFFLPG